MFGESFFAKSTLKTLLRASSLACLAFVIQSACAPADDSNDPNDPNMQSARSGTTDETEGESDNVTPIDIMPSGGDSGIRVVAPPQGAGPSFDVLRRTGGDVVLSGVGLNMLLQLSAGDYVLRQSSAPGHIFADNVNVLDGNTTSVIVGLVHIIAAPGLAGVTYDLYDGNGSRVVINNVPSGPELIVTQGPYRVVPHGFPGLVLARINVDQTSTVEVMVAGLQVTAPVGASNANYLITSSTASNVLADSLRFNSVIALPVGDYRVTEQGADPAIVFATSARVAAGAVTTIALGAIRYNGQEDVDILPQDGTVAIATNRHPRMVVAVLPGVYMIRDSRTGVILQRLIRVKPGEITDVQ